MAKILKAKLTLKEIMHKLPPEAQDWIKGMDRDELGGAETILNNVGEAAFLKYWPEYKKELQDLRIFFWKPGDRPTNR